MDSLFYQPSISSCIILSFLSLDFIFFSLFFELRIFMLSDLLAPNFIFILVGFIYSVNNYFRHETYFFTYLTPWSSLPLYCSNFLYTWYSIFHWFNIFNNYVIYLLKLMLIWIFRLSKAKSVSKFSLSIFCIFVSIFSSKPLCTFLINSNNLSFITMIQIMFWNYIVLHRIYYKT